MFVCVCACVCGVCVCGEVSVNCNRWYECEIEGLGLSVGLDIKLYTIDCPSAAA